MSTPRTHPGRAARNGPHSGPCKGFTLIDLLATLTIMVVAAALVLPTIGDNGRNRLIAASRIMASDIELAQVMTISNPNQPVVVRFVPGQAKYWLAYEATAGVPMKRYGTNDDYVVILGKGRARSAEGVSIALTDVETDTLTFDIHGGLKDMTANPAITLSLGLKWIQLRVAPTTGTITEVADND